MGKKSELSGDKEKLEKRRNDQDRLTEKNNNKLGIRRPYATSSHLVKTVKMVDQGKENLLEESSLGFFQLSQVDWMRFNDPI
jgi:hypothetical protein